MTYVTGMSPGVLSFSVLRLNGRARGGYQFQQRSDYAPCVHPKMQARADQIPVRYYAYRAFYLVNYLRYVA